MLCCFISTTSARMVASSRLRPVTGCHSCRFTPRNCTVRRLSRICPSRTSMRPETDPEADLAARAAQHRVVQPGVFVRPGLGRDPVLGAGVGAGDAEFRYRQCGRAVGVDGEEAGAVVRVVVGVHEEVPDQAGLLVDQGHAAEDAGQPPHVLILEVGPG